MQWQWRSQWMWGVAAVLGLMAGARLVSTVVSPAEVVATPAVGHRQISPVVPLGEPLPGAAQNSRQTAAWNGSLAKYPQGVKLTFSADAKGRPSAARAFELCQICVATPRAMQGVDCSSSPLPCQEARWTDAQLLPFETYGHGEYVGPARAPHVATYTIRVNDELDFVYRFTHEEIPEAYRLMVGDEIMIETYPQDEASIRRGDLTLGRGLAIQPDGTIVLPYVGRVAVAGRTIEEVQQMIQARFTEDENAQFRPGTIEVVVTPLKTNSTLESLRAAVDARFGTGGQTRNATVTPEGTVQLVGIGSVPAQGLTIPELEAEINARYVHVFGRGVQVSAILRQFAPRFIWVAGEVVEPGQYQVNQPLTVVQAIALAKGFNNGGNVREIVVFRRDDHWQLMATRLDVRGVFLGKTPLPSDDIWLRDNDVVVVPKGPILRADDFINLVFTRGIYSVLPLQANAAVRF